MTTDVAMMKDVVMLKDVAISGNNEKREYNDNKRANDDKRANDERRGNAERQVHQERPAHPLQNLSIEQEEKLQSMTDAHLKAIQPLRTQLAMKNAEYKAVMKNDNPDPDRAARVAGEISELSFEVSEMRRDYHMQIIEEFDLPKAPFPFSQFHRVKNEDNRNERRPARDDNARPEERRPAHEDNARPEDRPQS